MKNLVERYARVMQRAEEFAAVVEAIEAHPDLPEPSGVGPSKIRWRHRTGRTTYMGWITRVALELEGVIFTIAYTTPNTPPMMVNCGHQIYDEALKSHEDPQLADAVDRFAQQWHAAIKEDRTA